MHLAIRLFLCSFIEKVLSPGSGAYSTFPAQEQSCVCSCAAAVVGSCSSHSQSGCAWLHCWSPPSQAIRRAWLKHNCCVEEIDDMQEHKESQNGKWVLVWTALNTSQVFTKPNATTACFCHVAKLGMFCFPNQSDFQDYTALAFAGQIWQLQRGSFVSTATLDLQIDQQAIGGLSINSAWFKMPVTPAIHRVFICRAKVITTRANLCNRHI